jgi:hypothetical protein
MRCLVTASNSVDSSVLMFNVQVTLPQNFVAGIPGQYLPLSCSSPPPTSTDSVKTQSQSRLTHRSVGSVGKLLLALASTANFSLEYRSTHDHIIACYVSGTVNNYRLRILPLDLLDLNSYNYSYSLHKGKKH